VTRPTMPLVSPCAESRGSQDNYAQVSSAFVRNPERSPSRRSTRHSGRGACSTGAYRRKMAADILPEARLRAAPRRSCATSMMRRRGPGRAADAVQSADARRRRAIDSPPRRSPCGARLRLWTGTAERRTGAPAGDAGRSVRDLAQIMRAGSMCGKLEATKRPWQDWWNSCESVPVVIRGTGWLRHPVRRPGSRH